MYIVLARYNRRAFLDKQQPYMKWTSHDVLSLETSGIFSFKNAKLNVCLCRFQVSQSPDVSFPILTIFLLSICAYFFVFQAWFYFFYFFRGSALLLLNTQASEKLRCLGKHARLKASLIVIFLPQDHFVSDLANRQWVRRARDSCVCLCLSPYQLKSPSMYRVPRTLPVLSLLLNLKRKI